MNKDIKLGISIYPENQDMNIMKEYVKVAHELGYTRIFTSMLQVTKYNKDESISAFKEILDYCSLFNYEIVLDVAPYVFKELEIELPDISLFKELGVHTIRLDERIGNGIEAEILKNNENIEIELNVSTSTQDVDDVISEWGGIERIKSSHNFYPQKYTGISKEHLINQSLHCKDKGLRVQGFINSLSPDAINGPWNVNEGLCTLEDHRDLDPLTQAQDLLMLGCIDDISFGNSPASKEELERVAMVLDGKLILEIETVMNITDNEREVVFNYNNHFRRPDINDYSIRSTMGRVDCSNLNLPPRVLIKEQEIGEVYILNDNFDRYKCEVQVITKKMPYDNRKNLIGKLHDRDLILIKNVKPNQEIKFIEQK